MKIEIDVKLSGKVAFVNELHHANADLPISVTEFGNDILLKPDVSKQ